jgi:hypothetical protein
MASRINRWCNIYVPAIYFEGFNASNTVDDLKLVLGKMPVYNVACLEYILKFLNKLSKYSEINKMSPNNIGIVFGPTLFKCPAEETPMSQNYMLESIQTTGIITKIIENIDIIFPPELKGYCLYSDLELIRNIEEDIAPPTAANGGKGQDISNL